MRLYKERVASCNCINKSNKYDNANLIEKNDLAYRSFNMHMRNVSH